MNSTQFHIPVLVSEVIQYLVADKSGIYVDCTIGAGGHSLAILETLNNNGKLIGIDLDEEAISFSKNRLVKYNEQVRISHGNFTRLNEILQDEFVDGILLDLGVSSHQINTANRGFSYQKTGPLDMRMNSGQKFTAEDIINGYDVDELVKIFKQYGEERYAKPVATAIILERKKKQIAETGQLARIISRVVPFKSKIKSLSRIFQALRICVNQELLNLSKVLNQSIPCLKMGGRLVVISYHSLEDRIAKNLFSSLENPCTCPPEIPICVCQKKPLVKILTKRAVKPTQSEIEINLRSRSARLRAVEKIL